MNANITGFIENQNMTIKRTSGSNVILYVYGIVHQVKLDGTAQVYGTTWQYVNSNTVTRIVVGSHNSTFVSFDFGGFAGQKLTVTGYVLGPNGIFNRPIIFVTGPANANVTEIGLFDLNGILQDHVFTVPFPITNNIGYNVPWNFTDNSGRTGDVSYTEEVVVQSGNIYGIVPSNLLTLHYGATQVGNLNINQTNTNTLPIWFHQSQVSSNNIRLDVIYPNSANLTCNLAYTISQTNKTYFNLPSIPYDANNKNSSFLFQNSTNDIITVLCKNLKTTDQETTIITQNNFPFVQQINNFRSGMYGTHGQFGALDIITLSVMIISMIGFNRINESVGVFFSIAIIGGAAFFKILSFEGTLFGAIAIAVAIGILSTRKTGGF